MKLIGTSINLSFEDLIEHVKEEGKYIIDRTFLVGSTDAKLRDKGRFTCRVVKTLNKKLQMEDHSTRITRVEEVYVRAHQLGCIVLHSNTIGVYELGSGEESEAEYIPMVFFHWNNVPDSIKEALELVV